MKTIIRKDFLIEATLGLFLAKRLQKGKWVHNIAMPGTRIRPDYRNDYYKLIIEFDGFRHFSDPHTIINDKKRDMFYTQNNYTFIHIPYFIQLNITGVNGYFYNYTQEAFNDYPHGFIDPRAMLPAQFCSLGLQNFIHIMSFLNIPERNKIFMDIKKSLITKVKNGLPFAQVFPLDFIKLLNIDSSLNKFNKQLNNAINNEICKDDEIILLKKLDQICSLS